MPKKQNSISLAATFSKRINQGVDVSQICRTCGKGAQKHIFKCEPDQHIQLQPIPAPGQNVPVAFVKKPPKPRIATVVNIDGDDAFAWGNLEGCGYKQLDKCKNCGRFRPVDITVLAGKKPDGTNRYRQVTIGGFCSIPKEGIVVGTQVFHCHRVPKAIDLGNDTRQSCSTCRYSTAIYDTAMIEHATPLEFDLNSYEMEIARANPHPDLGVAGSISAMRRAKGQVPFKASADVSRLTPAWAGLRRSYRLRVVPGGITYKDYLCPDGSTESRAYSFKVYLGETGKTAELLADNADDRIGLVTQVSTHHVVVEVHAPYYRNLNLPDRNHTQKFVFETMPCRRCDGKGIVEDDSGPVLSPFRPDQREQSVYDEESHALHVPKGLRYCPECDSGEPIPPLSAPRLKPENFRGKAAVLPDAPKRSQLIQGEINERCPSCDPKWGPCYYHLKVPYHTSKIEYVIQKGGKATYEPRQYIEFKNPKATSPDIEVPQRSLKYDRTLNKVTDVNGDEPSTNILMLQWRSLLANANSASERQNITAQVVRAMATLPAGVTRLASYGWVRPSGLDPWHSFCALNQYDKDHGGHPDGSPDTTIGDISHVFGANTQQDMGVLTRGLDFVAIWNDQFGTPRSDQSTNPIRAYVNPSAPLLEDPYTIRDPKFSLPRYQARSEFERTTNPGMRIHENMLLNEGLLHAGRQNPTLNINGESVAVPYAPKQMPPNPKITKLRYGLPIEANVQFETRQELLDFLDEEIELQGSEKTPHRGYWITNRQRLLGYSLRHNMRIPDRDIISIAESEDEPHSDPMSPTQEKQEFLVCSVCFSEHETDDAGVFQAQEITDKQLMCPSGDGGMLIRRVRTPEWLESAYKLDSDQVRTFVDPTYRRTPEGELVSPPDSRSWSNKLRLEEMYCPSWQPKQQVPRNQV